MARSTSTGGAKKTTAKKAPAKKSGAKKAPAKKSAATKTAAKKTPAKKTAATKTAAKKAPAKKSAATKTAATKAPAKKSAATKTAATKAPAKKTPAKKTPAKKTPAKKTPATKASAPSRPRTPAKTLAPQLVVREDESPWTKSELKGVRKELEAEVTRLREEIEVAEHELVDLMRDHADGAGDDQADQGAKTFEREQEITLANNARAMLVQNLHALERLEDGTYGQCESCGNPIGKLRLQAYPRATLCVACKTKQERR